MIRIENASKLLNNSTGDVETPTRFLMWKKYTAAESIFHAIILLKRRDSTVIQIRLWLHWIFCMQ